MPLKNTAASDLPQAVRQQIALLGQHIALARKRRRETQAQWANKLGVSQPTMARIERGDPSVAMASYVMCMWLINQATGLAELIAPLHDHSALERDISMAYARGRPSGPVPMAAEPTPIFGANPPSGRVPLAANPSNAAAGMAALMGASKKEPRLE